MTKNMMFRKTWDGWLSKSERHTQKDRQPKHTGYIACARNFSKKT